MEIDRRIFGDGQISSPLPVHAARLLGATTVIAVDVIYPPDDAFLYSAASVVFQVTAHILVDECVQPVALNEALRWGRFRRGED